ncbi:NF038132 family protein [Litorilituus lipolyticus]|uniref:Ice-binding protein C-terminal domain-containing protein n=1 Tax=Litorilituus lipolyticus TaxID=2491017 RepID=A0A502L0A6_9GAMM|nr:NF038132 family protein [Litorilituus lipolyticus]TPH17302.1 hypothetical protein EPA86_04780 [Litorilituus lipolyticus]
MKNTKKVVAGAALSLLFSISASASVMQGTFDSGLPAGWDCTGNCGADAANGVVTAPPTGNSQYGWVSTANGVDGTGLPNIIGKEGSVLLSTLFSADAGDDLEFFFNYVTSDGSGFADYGWARLLDDSFQQVAMLFTARTKPSGNIVPGVDMPLPEATLTPGTVEIIGGGPAWSVLGTDSGRCYSGGCGYTGWVQSNYNILNSGNYYLEFGVTNWTDNAFDSGLAFDGITIGGIAIDEPKEIPEPAGIALFGLALMCLARAKKIRK